ncbi:MAG TPA: diaminopimelate epimerase [Verrucomicrobiota bacterium]|nr:diaminopimelate epimerase [Verrucomicrobiales bacterium]HRI13835.1 diaminopimelate epimerase [Verrucomicrobiota bacterium]
MRLDFVKMTGAGNDFILADNRSGSLQLSRKQVARLCHRQFGIGADGLILLVPARTDAADWAWQFWNSDGSDAEMCGNGARCFARYLQRAVPWTKPTVAFDTAAGVIHAQFQGEQVTVSLTAPRELRLREQVMTSVGPLEVSSLNTGVPHAVVFVPDADQAMVQQLGAELRWHEHFKPRGTNVNFVQVLAPNHIRVRTYERGVEGETLACGTGVSASALIASSVHGFRSPVRVQVQGGDELAVSYSGADGGFSHVQLTGPASFVFEGHLNL